MPCLHTERFGARARIISSPQKNKSPKRTGKKEEGLGEEIFCPPASLPKEDTGWEPPTSFAKQKGKTEKFSFLLLKEKNWRQN
jgi:hypothetical protein